MTTPDLLPPEREFPAYTAARTRLADAVSTDVHPRRGRLLPAAAAAAVTLVAAGGVAAAGTLHQRSPAAPSAPAAAPAAKLDARTACARALALQPAPLPTSAGYRVVRAVIAPAGVAPVQALRHSGGTACVGLAIPAGIRRALTVVIVATTAPLPAGQVITLDVETLVTAGPVHHPLSTLLLTGRVGPTVARVEGTKGGRKMLRGPMSGSVENGHFTFVGFPDPATPSGDGPVRLRAYDRAGHLVATVDYPR